MDGSGDPLPLPHNNFAFVPPSNNEEKLEFLESIVAHYESLVRDMTDELSSVIPLLKTSIMKDEQRNERLTEEDQDQLISELQIQEGMIQNLEVQIQTSEEAKTVLRRLWGLTLEHAERLERLKMPTMGPQLQQLSLTDNFLAKWNTLQAHAKMMEDRVEKLTGEVTFYHNKLIQVCIQRDANQRNRAFEEATKLQKVRDEQKVLMEKLQEELGLLQKDFDAGVKERVEREKEVWSYQEALSLRTIRIQVEELLLENETLAGRNQSLVKKVRESEEELEFFKEKLSLCKEEVCIIEEEIVKKMQLIFEKSQRQSGERNLPKNLVSSTSQTDPLSLPSYETNREQDFSETQKKIQSLSSQLRQSEKLGIEKAAMLLSRISQLEELNRNLHTQLTELTKVKEKEEKLEKEEQEIIKEKPLQLPLPEMNNVKNTGPKWDPQKVQIHCDNMATHRKDLQIQRLSQELCSVAEERKILLGMIEEQRLISEKWKREFKALAKASLI